MMNIYCFSRSFKLYFFQWALVLLQLLRNILHSFAIDYNGENLSQSICMTPLSRWEMRRVLIPRSSWPIKRPVYWNSNPTLQLWFARAWHNVSINQSHARGTPIHAVQRERRGTSNAILATYWLLVLWTVPPRMAVGRTSHAHFTPVSPPSESATSSHQVQLTTVFHGYLEAESSARLIS